VTSNGAYEEEMNEVALFKNALRAAVPTQPDPVLGLDLVPRLAQVARGATIEAETRATRRPVAIGAGRPRAGSRLALVARAGIAVAMIPLVLAGLAFAGVTVPAPARDAFDSLGITLPNQPSEEGQQQQSTPKSQQGGNDVSDAAKSANETAKGNSAAAHRHAREQRSKARGAAVGHSRGKAIGLNDLAPSAQSGNTGPPAHSNAGGSARSESARAAPQPLPALPGGRGDSNQPK